MLVTRQGGDVAAVSFACDSGIVTGYMAAEAVEALTAEEAEALQNALASGGSVALYQNDINWPLPRVRLPRLRLPWSPALLPRKEPLRRSPALSQQKMPLRRRKTGDMLLWGNLPQRPALLRRMPLRRRRIGDMLLRGNLPQHPALQRRMPLS